MSHHPLNPGDRVLFKGEYAGKWATVHEGPGGLNVFQFDGESYDRYIAVSTLADLIDRAVPAQDGKDIDVSKIDVGWRVRLDDSKCDLMDIFRNAWLEVVEASAEQLIVEVNGVRGPISRQFPFFLAALPPEPAKDPFAVGEWVVAKSNGAHINEGQLVQITQMVRPIVDYAVADHFFADGWYLLKSRFRPATPEEISAHLGKTLEETPLSQRTVAQCNEALHAKFAAEDAKPKPSEPDGKITFTVAGREFFVGQRVYSEVASTKFGVGCHLELLGAPPINVQGTLICREVGTAHLLWLSTSEISLEPHPVHEWQFGDQASHPDHGTVLVIDMTEPESFQCASPSDPEIFIDPSELTFIRRTDLGE